MFKIPQSLAAEETEVPPELVGRRQTAFPVVLTNPCAAPDELRRIFKVKLKCKFDMSIYF